MPPSRRPTFREVIEDAKALLTRDDLSAEEKVDLEQFVQETSESSDDEIEAYNFFTEHMPEESADLTLVILKAHLLVEQRVRSFIEARLFKPEALAAGRLSSHQLICLAEAMCLPNPEPAWLWKTIRELNALRNSLAHNLAPVGIQDRVNAFLAVYRERHAIHGELVGTLAHLYAQVTALAALAREPGFQIFSRETREGAG